MKVVVPPFDAAGKGADGLPPPAMDGTVASRLAGAAAGALALLLLAGVLGTGQAAEEVPLEEFQCDGGWCRDGKDRVLDCSAGHCQGTSHPYQFPTLVNPLLGDGSWLEADNVVLGVVVGGEARAYPIRILNWYETVRDEVGGEPVLVTYCPLCASGVVFSPVVDGRALTFLNSGEIWRSDLVMYDRETESRWTQIWGQAIRGLLTGTTLDVLPSSQVAWSAWKRAHPDTLAMEAPRDAEGNPVFSFPGDGFRGLELVHGVVVNGQALAFPVETVAEEGVVQVTFAGEDLVAAHAGAGIHVYRAAGRTFADHNATHMRDGAGVLYDKLTGTSPAGDLEPVQGITLYRFAWENFHPDTAHYGGRSAESSSLTGLLPLLGLGAAVAAVAGTLLWRWRRRRRGD